MTVADGLKGWSLALFGFIGVRNKSMDSGYDNGTKRNMRDDHMA